MRFGKEKKTTLQSEGLSFLTEQKKKKLVGSYKEIYDLHSRRLILGEWKDVGSCDMADMPR